MLNYAEKEDILRDFVKLISFYHRKNVRQYGELFDDMDGLLTLFLLELIEAGKCISKRYVAVAIRNEYIRISKEFLCLRNRRCEFLDFCKSDFDFTYEVENKMLICDVLKTLTDEQKNVVKLRYCCSFSCSEIADFKGVSRQSVSQTKKRALDKMKTLL